MISTPEMAVKGRHKGTSGPHLLSWPIEQTTAVPSFGFGLTADSLFIKDNFCSFGFFLRFTGMDQSVVVACTSVGAVFFIPILWSHQKENHLP